MIIQLITYINDYSAHHLQLLYINGDELLQDRPGNITRKLTQEVLPRGWNHQWKTEEVEGRSRLLASTRQKRSRYCRRNCPQKIKDIGWNRRIETGSWNCSPEIESGGTNKSLKCNRRRSHQKIKNWGQGGMRKNWERGSASSLKSGSRSEGRHRVKHHWKIKIGVITSASETAPAKGSHWDAEKIEDWSRHTKADQEILIYLSIHSFLWYSRLNMKINIIFMPLFCRTACRHAATPLSIPKSSELFHRQISAIFDSRSACSMPDNGRTRQCLCGDILHRGHIYSFCLKASSRSSDLFIVLSLDSRSWSWFCDSQL